MRGGGLIGRQLALLIVTLGIVLEIPLVGYVLTRDDGQSFAVATTQNNLGGAEARLPA